MEVTEIDGSSAKSWLTIDEERKEQAIISIILKITLNRCN